MFLRAAVDGGACGLIKKTGKGKTAILSAPYIGNRPGIRRLMEYLGASCRLSEDAEYGGVFMDINGNERGEKYLHILNLDFLQKNVESGIMEKHYLKAEKSGWEPGKDCCCPFV